MYTELVNVLYCKLLTIGKQLPTFPNRVWISDHRPQRWRGGGGASVLPLWPFCSKRQRDGLKLWFPIDIFGKSIWSAESVLRTSEFQL